MRRIYAQGDLDGACFLYSIVNAYVALQHEQPEFAAVCKAFGQVDWPGDFLDGSVGTTGSYEGNYRMLEDNIVRVLSILGSATFSVHRISGHFSAEMLEDLLSAKSVVLVRYKGSSRHAAGMDHWVCVVDYDRPGRVLHVACSVRLQKACTALPCDYVETFRERYGRWSNDTLSEAFAHSIVEEEIFQIATRSPG